jgi:hypothetical protein
MLPAAALRAILICEDSEQQGADCFGLLCSFCYFCGESISMTMMPNKSPEPTAVGAVSSAIAVHAASRRWLSFFR